MAKRAGQRMEAARGAATVAPGLRSDGASVAPGLRSNGATVAPGPRSNGNLWLTVRGAAHNNLRSIDAGLPLGRFVCVTGVSGSGKSSLVNDILYAALARDLNGATTCHPGAHAGIDGLEHLDKVINIDQSPIGRTPRSNPGTYIKVFDEIRTLFARLPDSQLRGYKPGRFSFNVATGPKGGGRCEACEGNGANRIEMDFLADVWVTCPVCDGHRFSHETLQIRYKSRNISDVLEMDVQDALEHFENLPRIRSMLQTLHDVGLDYIKLGQSSTTLSGGEAQRVKLSRELVKKPTGRTMYILDEPTTGLHFDDIKRLLGVLHGFVDAGNTVVVIEHNLDVIKTADWVIDLGPEGGDAGGEIVAEGTPEEIAECDRSHTGRAMRGVLRGESSELRVKSSELRVKSGQSSAISGDATASGPELATRSPELATHADAITVVGARQHNLKNLTISIPRDRTTVCTGVSGSGKTSFAIDTVYTEGHRRYVESLSAYARQFLGQMAKPRVDQVHGLSPAICIEQKSAGKSPRSTVGTITEVYDYMRVLWSRVGTSYCHRCKVPIGTQTADEITERVMSLGEGSPIILLTPMSLGDGETYAGMFNRLRNSGYTRVRVDGEIQKTAMAGTIDARRKHRVEVVVDRAVVRARSRSRIAESVEHALALGNGLMIVLRESFETVDTDENGVPLKTHKRPPSETLYSQRFACAQCGASYSELSPHHLSFNSQLGWCETCEGLGVQRGAPADTIIRDERKSLFHGAIAGWKHIDRHTPLGKLLSALCRRIGVEPSTPLEKWNDKQRGVLMFGGADEWTEGAAAAPGLRFQWKGFFPAIDHATRNSWMLRHRLASVMSEIPCIACRGGRLRPDASAIRLGRKTIVEVCEMPLRDSAAFFKNLILDPSQRRIAGELLKEIRNRLQFLIDVGLDYVSLHRSAATLAGGESQRIRLAGQLGSGLSGVLYVLDEPTVGLHPRDTGRLIRALNRLRDLGNTLLIVEHDRDVIRAADQLIDFGPDAGVRGGRLVAQGSPKDLMRRRRTKDGDESWTRKYLCGESAVPVPSNRRPTQRFTGDVGKPPGRRKTRASKKRGSAASRHRASAALENAQTAQTANGGPAWLHIRGARQNNLRNIDVPIPLGRLVAVTGVSGSGKSSLINDILWPALAGQLQRSGATPGAHEGIDGIDHLDKAINVDQSPIGTTPSSNPATYTGAFDWIRELFTRLPDSKVRGYNANRFSFNRPGGRCEACEGYGRKCIEMHFLPDVWIECETCRGRRYNPETLEVKYKGRSIADVLEMSVAAALELFTNVPKVRRMLQTLADVGLDYVHLGQPAPTLSAGEAQRVKLAAELGKPSTGRTLYMLDEPTTGLHFHDVRKLLDVLQRLVDLGNSVIVIEHNLDVLKCVDWIIDLGPEAGAEGGRVVASGLPEKVVKSKRSHTGAALRPILEAGPHEPRAVFDARAHAERELQINRSRLVVDGDAKMPWEADGRMWHLRQRTSRQDRAVRWDSAALEFTEKLIQEQGGFAPTDWNDRSRVEITAAGADTWFFHALTGGEWLLDFTFRVPTATFAARALNQALGLKKLDQRDDLPVYGNTSRVHVRRARRQFDRVRVQVHDQTEIDTPAFRAFVKKASNAYIGEFAPGPGGTPSRRPRKSAKPPGASGTVTARTRLWTDQTLESLVALLKKSLGRVKQTRENDGLTHFRKGNTLRAALTTSVPFGIHVQLYPPADSIDEKLAERVGRLPRISRGEDGRTEVSFWVQRIDDVDVDALNTLSLRPAAGSKPK